MFSEGDKVLVTHNYPGSHRYWDKEGVVKSVRYTLQGTSMYVVDFQESDTTIKTIALFENELEAA